MRPQTGRSKGPKPECAKCGKNHYGECRMGTDSFFKCGQPGHFAKECPQIVSGSGSGVGQTGQRQFNAGRGQGQSQRGVSDRGPPTLLDLEDQQVEVSHLEDRWDDLRHRLGCLQSPSRRQM